jgi:ribosomal protein L40E
MYCKKGRERQSMAIIDKLSKIAKSVSDEAVNVAKKSGELIEITKLNNAISTEEDKINAVLPKMGNIIYQRFKNGENIDPELLTYCNKIEDIKANIAALKQKILEVKNIKICPGCNSELSPEVVFCPKCGAKQETAEVVEAEEMKTCPKCAAAVPVDSAFCTSCGAKM